MKGIELVNLVAHSARMGSDPNLVQAGGGNTSWKNGSTIFYLDGRGFSLIFLILDLRSPELILIGISIL